MKECKFRVGDYFKIVADEKELEKIWLIPSEIEQLKEGYHKISSINYDDDLKSYELEFQAELNEISYNNNWFYVLEEHAHHLTYRDLNVGQKFGLSDPSNEFFHCVWIKTEIIDNDKYNDYDYSRVNIYIESCGDRNLLGKRAHFGMSTPVRILD